MCFNCVCGYVQITELSQDLEKELEQYQVLQKYTEEYQSSSSCKVWGLGGPGGPLHILCVLFCWLQIAVLKENVAKADLEIAELDKLVDHVREVCHLLIPAVFGHFLFCFVCISLCTLAITVHFCIPLVR